jgi:N utilization substance protein B
LLSGTVEHVDEIDDLIACASENWSIDRMPIVDLSVLRMAIFEMKYLDDVPLSVSINEAVDLAKHYGGEDDSSRFVNGVLGKIAVMLEQDGLSASDVLKAPETSAHDTEDTQDRPDIQEALPEPQELQETAPPEQEN